MGALATAVVRGGTPGERNPRLRLGIAALGVPFPRLSQPRWRALCLFEPRCEADATCGVGCCGEALCDGEASYPGDLACGFDDGESAAQLAGDLAVGEEVLEGLGAAEAEWADAIAVAPGADGDGLAEGGGVELDL